MIHKVVKGLLPQKPPQKLLAGCWFSPKRRNEKTIKKKRPSNCGDVPNVEKQHGFSKFNVHPFVRRKCFVWDSPLPMSQIVPVELRYATFQKKNMRIMFLLTFNIPLSTTYTSHPFFRYLYKSPWSPMGRKFDNLDTSPLVLVHLGSTSAASLATGADAVSLPDPGCRCRS